MDLKLSLAAVLIAGGVIGVALPGEDDAALPSAYAAQAGSDASVTEQVNLAVAQDGVSSMGLDENTVLRREADGHFYADARVDGRDYRMLVDTGASIVALTAADAEDMGITWNDQDVRVVARGAGGEVRGVNVTIERLAVGSHEATGVSAVVIPEGLEISLLGQSFLSTVASVAINGDDLVLGD